MNSSVKHGLGYYFPTFSYIHVYLCWILGQVSTPGTICPSPGTASWSSRVGLPSAMSVPVWSVTPWYGCQPVLFPYNLELAMRDRASCKSQCYRTQICESKGVENVSVEQEKQRLKTDGALVAFHSSVLVLFWDLVEFSLPFISINKFRFSQNSSLLPYLMLFD